MVFDKALRGYLEKPDYDCDGVANEILPIVYGYDEVESEIDSITLVGKKAFVKACGTIHADAGSWVDELDYLRSGARPKHFSFEGDFELDLENESIISAKMDATELNEDE